MVVAGQLAATARDLNTKARLTVSVVAGVLKISPQNRDHFDEHQAPGDFAVDPLG